MRLLVACANDIDGTSFYRGLAPLAALQKHHSKLQVISDWGGGFDYNENRLRLCDMLFLQRPFADYHLALARMANDLGIPIWIDQDDAVFDLPEGHPNKGNWDVSGSMALQQQELLQMAEVVTTTTEALRANLSRYSKNVIVVPNAFDDLLLMRKRKATPLRGPVPAIAWRGSNHHEPDLLGLENELPPLCKEFPSWKWIFLGHNPYFLTARLPREVWNFVGWQGTMGYFNCLNRIQPRLVMVPLLDHEFNRCKSNIAWIEASFANAAVIAPRLPEWQKPGVLTYDPAVKNGEPDSFSARLKEALRGDHDLDAMAADGWSFVEKHLKLSDVNELRAKILGV